MPPDCRFQERQPGQSSNIPHNSQPNPVPLEVGGYPVTPRQGEGRAVDDLTIQNRASAGPARQTTGSPTERVSRQSSATPRPSDGGRRDTPVTPTPETRDLTPRPMPRRTTASRVRYSDDDDLMSEMGDPPRVPTPEPQESRQVGFAILRPSSRVDLHISVATPRKTT